MFSFSYICRAFNDLKLKVFNKYLLKVKLSPRSNTKMGRGE